MARRPAENCSTAATPINAMLLNEFLKRASEDGGTGESNREQAATIGHLKKEIGNSYRPL